MESDPSFAIGALIIGSEILTGKRQDKHLARVIERLASRGLTLAWAHYLGDDRGRLTALLRETFARGGRSPGPKGASPGAGERADARRCARRRRHSEATGGRVAARTRTRPTREAPMARRYSEAA